MTGFVQGVDRAKAALAESAGRPDLRTIGGIGAPARGRVHRCHHAVVARHRRHRGARNGERRTLHRDAVPPVAGYLGAALGAFAVSVVVTAAIGIAVTVAAPLPVADVIVAYAPGAVDAMMILALALNLDPVSRAPITSRACSWCRSACRSWPNTFRPPVWVKADRERPAFAPDEWRTGRLSAHPLMREICAPQAESLSSRRSKPRSR